MSKNKYDLPETSAEFFDGLEDLNIEETEALLSGINKVTLLPDEEMSIKEKVLQKVGTKESGNIREAESKSGTSIGIAYFKHRKFMTRAAAFFAAVMVCSAVAIAATNMDALQRFWGNDTEIYGNRAFETVQSVQNENVKVNIEGIVSDNYQCVFILSMEALTDEGRKLIKNASDPHNIAFAIKITPAFITGATDQGSSGIFQYTDDNKNKDYKAYRCDFELENVDLTQPATVEFAGLTMSFDIPSYMQVITLYPDSDAGFESVDLSPVGYYYKAVEFAEEIRLINSDGTLDEELGYHGSMYQENNEEAMVIGSFTRLIDLNDYLGIQIDGIKYTRQH